MRASPILFVRASSERLASVCGILSAARTRSTSSASPPALTADPVQRPSLVKRLGLTTPVADVWLYQIWAFVAPGLNTREKRWSSLLPGAAIPLFGLGNTPCHLSLGRSLRYLLGLTPGGVQNLTQVDQNLSSATAMTLAFGLAFEVPLLIVMLNLVGVLTHERFRKWRRVLIFGVS